MLINRQEYIDRLIKNKKNGFIKVITGVRRCGKSSILRLWKEYLERENGINSIYYLDLSAIENLGIREYDDLLLKVTREINDSHHYILIDEPQIINGWERIVNGYFSQGDKYDIYITGSNGHLLSRELGTLLTGRYIEIECYPLSFKEYLLFSGYDGDLYPRRYLNNYLKYGGFPSIVLQEIEYRQNALSALLDSILYNDVLPRTTVSSEILSRLVKVLHDSISSPISINKIVNTLKSANYRVYNQQIKEAIKALDDSFLLYDAELCFIKGRERFGLLDKQYSVDTGLVALTSSIFSENRGAILENLVYLELKRRCYRKIAVGRDGDFEVDFIAERFDGKIEYYQVSESLIDSKTREREFKVLEEINDNFPKYVITLDEFDYSRNGIIHKELTTFLLGK